MWREGIEEQEEEDWQHPWQGIMSFRNTRELPYMMSEQKGGGGPDLRLIDQPNDSCKFE